MINLANMDYKKYAEKDTLDITNELSVDPAVGLSESDALSRLEKNGLNQLPESKVSAWSIFFRQFKSSFIYLLFAASLLSFVLGETIEGWMIVLFLFINTFLGFYQEYRSEKTVELLKKFVTTKVKVRRDGSVKSIDASKLTVGDIVLFEAGDSIPADIRIIESLNLTINEEPLTGESIPIIKEVTKVTDESIELHNAKNIVFSGTTVITGNGTGVVFSTGTQTVMGGIAKLAGNTKRESKFEQELAKFSKYILYLVVTTLTFIFTANILIKGWDTDIITLAIFSIALAVSVIPEALPVVMTFSLSRGARRLAENHVIVKRLSSIEDLGSVEVLCTDKTGTLTENKLTVHNVFDGTENPNKAHIILTAGMGGEYTEKQETGSHPDPFDSALWEALNQEQQGALSLYRRISKIPFDPVRKKNSILLKHQGKTFLVVRGATEAVLDASIVDEEKKKKIIDWVADEGLHGRRTLAVATKELSAEEYDNAQDESSLSFIGCVSFVDPIKKSTIGAIQQAIDLNISIKILTGDSKEVAGNVACEVGLAKNPNEAMLARDLFLLPYEEQMLALERINVFARVSPEEKYKIISLLQKKYQVGFLGEGINDAPALKIANVAIVVESASDIAREAADIILLESSLDVVVGGIREGRQIFANTIKYIRSSLSSNFGNFYAVAISSLFIPFLPMLPLQILLVNLLSDFPAIAIATDTVDQDELREPQQYNIRKIIMFGTVLGIVSTVFDFITFAYFSKIGETALQTNWFIVSILTEILFLYSIRTRKLFFKTRAPSLPLMSLSIIAIIATVTIPFTSFGQSMFGFVAPTVHEMTVIGIIVLTYIITTEIVKLVYYRLSNNQSA